MVARHDHPSREQTILNRMTAATQVLHRHPDTFMELADLGTRIPAYRPTFSFPNGHINASHRFFSMCPVKDEHLIQMLDRRWWARPIRGWLRREDALKLYEMAYFASGDILELGSYQGLSTCVLSQANRDSSARKTITSVDLDPRSVRLARRNLRSLGLALGVEILCDDAFQLVSRLAAEEKRFGFVFVDHSHHYEPMLAVCRGLAGVVAPSGFCLFHDFNDVRNRDPQNQDYRVYQAVKEGLDMDSFEFYGIYGCTALYRRR